MTPRHQDKDMVATVTADSDWASPSASALAALALAALELSLDPSTPSASHDTDHAHGHGHGHGHDHGTIGHMGRSMRRRRQRGRARQRQRQLHNGTAPLPADHEHQHDLDLEPVDPRSLSTPPGPNRDRDASLPAPASRAVSTPPPPASATCPPRHRRAPALASRHFSGPLPPPVHPTDHAAPKPPGLDPSRPSLRLLLDTPQRPIDIVLATSWAEVDLHLPWLLADALVPSGLPTHDDPPGTDRLPLYVLGMDTETYPSRPTRATARSHAPREAPHAAPLPDTEDFLHDTGYPSTIQLASYGRVLIIPLHWLARQGRRKGGSATLAALFANPRVKFTGVALLGDLDPLYRALNVPRITPAGRVLDLELVVREWRVPAGLDELGFQFTSLLTSGTAHIDTVHGVHVDADPHDQRAWVHDEDALLCLGHPALGDYPRLHVGGWKSTPLSMATNWDVNPARWTVAMTTYAGLDALVSRAVGLAVAPVVNPGNWTPAAAKARGSAHPLVAVNPTYVPFHTRLSAAIAAAATTPAAVVSHDSVSPLVWIRHMLAHLHFRHARPRRLPAPAGGGAAWVLGMSSVHHHVKSLRLLRGVRNKQALVDRAVDWLVAAGLVEMADLPRTAGHVERCITHVRVDKPLGPLGHVPMPPPPTRAALAAFLVEELPRIPGTPAPLTREAAATAMAWTHPDLALMSLADARRLATQWLHEVLTPADWDRVASDWAARVRALERGLGDRAGVAAEAQASARMRDREREKRKKANKRGAGRSETKVRSLADLMAEDSD